MNNHISAISSFDSYIYPETDGYIASEKLMIKKNTYLSQMYLLDELYPFLRNCCKIKHHHHIWYKTDDFLGPDLKKLSHTENEYCESEYWLIDQRGISRSLNHTDLFLNELQLLTQIYYESPNVAILLPFVRDGEQMERCYEIIRRSKFPGKYGITIDLVSTICALKELIDLGISNVTVNINNLAVFVLGAYTVPAYSINHDAVFQYICKINDILKNSNIELNIAGTISKLDIEKYQALPIHNYIYFE